VTLRKNPGAGHPVLGSAADRFEAQDQQDEWVWSQEYPMVLAEVAASTIGSSGSFRAIRILIGLWGRGTRSDLGFLGVLGVPEGSNSV
jgi:hypothetical protein